MFSARGKRARGIVRVKRSKINVLLKGPRFILRAERLMIIGIGTVPKYTLRLTVLH